MANTQDDAAVVRLTREIEDRLRDRLRAAAPAHGQAGRHVAWKRRDMLAGKIGPAGVLPALLAEAIVHGAPVDALRDVLQDLDLVVLRERAPELLGVGATDWVAALVEETHAQGSADDAQTQALATRTTGDQRAARDGLLRHRARIDRALVALDRSIADDADLRAQAGARLRALMPA